MNCTQTVQTLPDKGMQCQNLTFFTICLGSYLFRGTMSTSLPYSITVVCAQHVFSQRRGRQCSILDIWSLKRFSQITEVIFMLKWNIETISPFYLCRRMRNSFLLEENNMFECPISQSLSRIWKLCCVLFNLETLQIH